MNEQDMSDNLQVGQIYTGNQLKSYSMKFQDEKIYFISDTVLYDEQHFVVNQLLENKSISFRNRGFQLGDLSSNKLIVILKRI